MTVLADFFDEVRAEEWLLAATLRESSQSTLEKSGRFSEDGLPAYVEATMWGLIHESPA
jgi:hypothetical protein